MFENFKLFNIESKDSIMMKTEITGKMSEDGAKEVAHETNKIIADGKRFFIKCVGISLIILAIGYVVGYIITLLR